MPAACEHCADNPAMAVHPTPKGSGAGRQRSIQRRGIAPPLSPLVGPIAPLYRDLDELVPVEAVKAHPGAVARLTAGFAEEGGDPLALSMDQSPGADGRGCRATHLPLECDPSLNEDRGAVVGARARTLRIEER